ncbi:TetR/AcrR family transcriptional regulator [Streptomyces orinoci]|uniref:Helix-turn-helix domain-containing protein n=1 Tax=Streptomyces orinoci TaxID=67339 RepID=A0ABV3JYI2_STRON|nr:TetR/AcrR family transcriptional regulator [Streptomyces orinoci]
MSREEILRAAARLVRERGPRALTMRRLAEELGTAVTAIYWHVGNREALLDALVERTLQEFAAIHPTGRTPRTRIVSLARTLRAELRARPHLIAMVHERGLTERLFLPVRQALVKEAQAAGLRGARAAALVRAVEFLVVGSVLVEKVSGPEGERMAADTVTDGAKTGGAVARDAVTPDAVVAGEGDRALERALARPPDPGRLFELSVRAVVRDLLSR